MSTVIVIGSGVAGLASALRFSIKGYKVHVFESNNYVGGKIAEIKEMVLDLMPVPHYLQCLSLWMILLGYLKTIHKIILTI